MSIVERKRSRPRKDIFDAIYRRNTWKGAETRSGPGSELAATATMSQMLLADLELRGIMSVLDAGCGEGRWQPDMPGYVGMDIVQSALDVARRQHPRRQFLLGDICTDELPMVDAVLCRDALQHLSLEDGLAAIENFRRTGACFLYAGSFRDGHNRDVRTGRYYEPDLTRAPFALGRPRHRIPDGYWPGQLKFPSKYLGVWSLQDSVPRRKMVMP